MSDLDILIRESLDERAEAYVVPPAPGELVVARARREQRHRRVTGTVAALAAAAVVAVAVVPHLGGPAPVAADRPSAGPLPSSAVAQREAAFEWARQLPEGKDAPFTSWPMTTRHGGSVSMRIGDRDIAAPAGITELTELRAVADGYVVIGHEGTDVTGSATVLHFSRLTGTATAMVEQPGITQLMLDPDRTRVAWLAPDGSSAKLGIVDLRTGAGRDIFLPSQLDSPVLAAWNPMGVVVAPAGATAVGGASTSLWMYDLRTAHWTDAAIRVEARIDEVVRLDSFGGSTSSPLVVTEQGSQKCVSRLTEGISLTPLQCWPRTTVGRPSAVVSPGGTYALVGLSEAAGQGATLHDLTTAQEVTTVREEALAAGIGDYVWTGPRAFAARALSPGDPGSAVPYRYDLTARTGEQLPHDPRTEFGTTYDPSTTGLTVPRGTGA